jgi:NTE family protein
MASILTSCNHICKIRLDSSKRDDNLGLRKPRISKVWRIDRLESADAIFGKVTDFTPTTIKQLIQAGRIDARISINRMELIFGIEELISEGIMSIEEGDEIIRGQRCHNY